MKTSPALIIILISVIVATDAGFVVGADDFPLRKRYPQLQAISTAELVEARAARKAIVIDVRTRGEFDVMHIEGAKNIPHILNDKQYSQLKSVGEAPHQYIVFYCNGGTCSKSYKAAELATLLGFKGVRNYDAGIVEWAETHPEETIFFGQPMSASNVKEKLIAESNFRKALVDTRSFLEMVRSGKYAVYDIRDSREKAEYPINLANKKEATIDQLQQLLKEGKFPMSDVLLLDNVGRQVIWAQYYLERFGVKNYFFLDGGVEQWRADGLNSEGNQAGRIFGRAKKK